MNEHIDQLLRQMATLEAELQDAMHQQDRRMFFQVKGKRVEFERSVLAAHRLLKTKLMRWLVTNRPQNLITGPLICAKVLPMMLTDPCVSVYQWTCFPIYGIKRVPRSGYRVFDRRHLGYLNLIEQFHCTYCEHGNGLKACMTEILARTEPCFCPIKHAHKVLGPHERHERFPAYGDAPDHEARLEACRLALAKEA